MINQKINPYQRNVDIVKGFFKKPIILILSIVMSISCISSMFSGYFTAPFLKQITNKIIDSSQINVNTQTINNAIDSTSSFSLPLTSILVIVAFFLFYFFSKNSNNNLKVPATIFKIVSLIEMIFICIGIFVALLVMSILTLYFFSYDFANNAGDLSSTSISYIKILSIISIVAIIVVGAIAIIFLVAKYRFASSIKKSITSINLQSKGAMIFGVISIVCGIINFIDIPALIMNTTGINLIFLLLANILSACNNILLGVVAIQYNKYIKSYAVTINEAPKNTETSDTENIVAPTPTINQPVVTYPSKNNEGTGFCNACGNPVGPDDYFCNNCGNKLK